MVRDNTTLRLASVPLPLLCRYHSLPGGLRQRGLFESVLLYHGPVSLCYTMPHVLLYHGPVSVAMALCQWPWPDHLNRAYLYTYFEFRRVTS